MNKGIENLKAALLAAAVLWNKLDETLEDKKVNFFEGITLIKPVIEVAGIVKTWPEIKAEFWDLDGSERSDLIKIFASEFDIRNDEAEEKIEALFAWVISTSSVMEIYQKFRK